MAPAVEVADIFRHHGEAFRQAHAGHLGRVERRVMGAITACRTAALGGHVEQCDCGTIRIAYNSCRNRHCPKCQGLARAQWLANASLQLIEVHPIPHRYGTVCRRISKPQGSVSGYRGHFATGPAGPGPLTTLAHFSVSSAMRFPNYKRCAS
jgi:Transposase zinc-binding domain